MEFWKEWNESTTEVFVLLALCANFAAQLSAQKLLPVSVAVSTNYQLNGVAVSHDDRIFLRCPGGFNRTASLSAK